MRYATHGTSAHVLPARTRREPKVVVRQAIQPPKPAEVPTIQPQIDPTPEPKPEVAAPTAPAKIEVDFGALLLFY